MSCRVIGRCLEFWILKKIIDKSMNMGFEKIKLEYINTKRNSVVVDFINKLNIVNFEIKNNDKIIFEINIKKFKVPNLEIFN
jgi:predicted enzyme involved in methoxymalonyl-ACP biosynthesis